MRIYYIDLIVVPDRSGPSIERVTFQLDQSYNRPLRYADRETQFTTQITSYGDFAVIATVQDSRGFIAAKSEFLSELLERGHGDDLARRDKPAEAIQQAIETIKAN